DCTAPRCNSTRTAHAHIVPPGSGTRYLADLVHLDQVAFLDIVEVGQTDSALETLGNLAGVVLEPLQGVDGARVGHDPVAEQSGPGAALDDSLGDIAAGHGAGPGDLEHGPHLGGAEDHFLLFGGELAHQELFDVVQEFVDDPVGADLDPGLLGQPPGAGLGADVEADDDGLGDVGQGDVVLVDSAHRTVNDLDASALSLDLADRFPQRLERALGVGLD